VKENIISSRERNRPIMLEIGQELDVTIQRHSAEALAGDTEENAHPTITNGQPPELTAATREDGIFPPMTVKVPLTVLKHGLPPCIAEDTENGRL